MKRRLPGIYHFFHVVSTIRPIVWIGIYVACTPLFALIYWALPDGQFRIPDGGGTDFGSWLYYSIVTITTLGFGDYTPAHGWAQAITAIEVMCGLVFLGFFLNAVGSLKSENDIESELEKQQEAHKALELQKLQKSIPMVIHNLVHFLECCQLPGATESGTEAMKKLEKSAARTSLCLDSLESRVDLTLWPEILEDCFAFVANWQMLSESDLTAFVKENTQLAAKLQKSLTLLEG